MTKDPALQHTAVTRILMVKKYYNFMYGKCHRHIKNCVI
jgi:hypothetical protein